MVALGLLGAGLAGVIVLEAVPLTDPVPATPPRPAPAPVAETEAAPDRAGRLAADAATALARPLFRPDRRPPRAAPDAVASTGLPRLAGVMTGPGGGVAMFAREGGEGVVTVEEGGSIGRWQVRRIAPDGVTLSGPEGNSTVGLAFASGLVASSAPQPAPPERPPALLQRLPPFLRPGVPPGARRSPRRHRRRIAGPLLLALTLAACAQPVRIEYPPGTDTNAQPPPALADTRARLDGAVAAPAGLPAPTVSMSAQGLPTVTDRGAPVDGGPADITLDFADADIRTVVAQVIGTMLGRTYAVDPAVRGSVTLRTPRPVSRAQLVPILQAVLAQQGATLIDTGGVVRVVPAAAAGGINLAPASGVGAGSIAIPLRFASAEELARVLAPYVGQNARIVAEPSRNALVIAGEPEARGALVAMVQAFDTNLLAGQSYALFPVTTGSAQEMATAMQEAMRAQSNGALAGLVRVVPMERLGAVLVVSSQPGYVDQARRIFGVVDSARRQRGRTWYVHHVQNGSANDMAYVLQQAFTPGSVTAQPSPRNGRAGLGGIGGPGGMGGALGGMGGGMGSGGLAQAASGASPLGGGTAGLPAGSLPTGGGGAIPLGGGPAGGSAAAGAAANPLLGGLDTMGLGGGGNPETLRIVPHEQNNALLIYATRAEYDQVQGMLRRLDVMPLQVRIDATIAEVALNDQLNYGTQFFFRNGGLAAALATTPLRPVVPALDQFVNGALPGFVLGGESSGGGATAAISALQAVTEVNVLSTPQLMVADNQTARIQVGNLVPYLSQSSQSTLIAGSPVINSINYQPTGVIMQITPRISSSGLVTLDIAQDVSEVDTNATTNGISSPTFLARNVVSRVVVQDGQTIGLAGLIRDSSARGNDGIPWLKDIPILGLLAGSQRNQRARTELIVLLTPRVVRDQREARALTEDLREQLPNAAAVPSRLRATRPSGSADPGRRVRQELRLDR